ncbi:MAG: KpsF/GutQ family sugar-phosphate isomerase [Bacteroidales bacterium]|nr:KpsF/GutQ family sugar-phosphate isomerase [Bacteroidales bacterium]MBP5680441.1 KpsF/GutQ family sugar-phosphate isomerase [Bacteroidales bacterium]
MSEILETGINCLTQEAQSILDLVPRMGKEFEEAVNLMLHCSGKVIVTGVGKSGHIGSKIAATLASTGTPSFYLNPLDAYHGDLGMIASGDVVMAISYSGNTDELLRFMPLLLERQIPIIGISGNSESLLAKYSKVHLNIAVNREADPLNLAPTSSTTATLAMGDALACALVQARHFKDSDFAKFHPGGSLGKRLLGRVQDFMDTDMLNVWKVSPTDALSDVIIQISEGKKGLVVALEQSSTEPLHKVVGIITDGDMRRAMQKYRERFFSLKVEDVMSRNPKKIHQDAKLSEAADLMLSNSIHALIVLDEREQFCGIIDYFTCV